MLLLGILFVFAGVDGYLSLRDESQELDRDAGTNSLTIARMVAADPVVVQGLSGSDPARVIDPIAETFRRTTGATFVVVADRRGVRYSHPDPALIGTSLLNDPGENPDAVLTGGTYIGVQHGSMGRSVRAKAPIRDDTGQVIGLVSVGTRVQDVHRNLWSRLVQSFLPPLLALVLAVIGALLVARRIKRQTYGLEPAEITAMLEQREAMLHSTREGLITLDLDERVTLVNDEAERLLDIDRAAAVGELLADLVPAGRVREVLAGRVSGRDEIILVGDHILVVNHMPVEVRGRPVGAVVTLRDRTELDELLRELNDTRSLADALRAQEHEFANRLHVIGGLIELGRYQDAVDFIDRTSLVHQQLASRVVEGVGDPILSALLLGKAAVASERGIELTVSTTGTLHEELDGVEGLVTVLGNLIDNALESAHAGGRVQVTIVVGDAELEFRVHDSGPGIDESLSQEIFRHGYTTKAARAADRRRGLGLALVSREVHRRGGRIEVRNDGGALFTVVTPLRYASTTAQDRS